MTNIKKRIISSITTLAVIFSFGAASALDAYDTDDGAFDSVKLDYEHIEELDDGGKIYFYLIDGVEHKFPVPPDGFDPLTASDEQLETYGFPPRPDKENIDEYESWVEIMSCYKSTPVPEIELVEEDDIDIAESDEFSSISNLSLISDITSVRGSRICSFTRK